MQSKYHYRNHSFLRIEFGRGTGLYSYYPIFLGTNWVLKSYFVTLYCFELSIVLLNWGIVIVEPNILLEDPYFPLDFITSRILKVFYLFFSYFHLLRFFSFYFLMSFYFFYKSSICSFLSFYRYLDYFFIYR